MSLKEIRFSDRLQRAGKAYEQAQRAAQELESVASHSAPQVTADWDLKSDGNITLRLSDWTGSVETEFASKELDNTDRLGIRLVRHWGDLLQMRSHKTLEELRQSIEAGERG